MIKVTILYVISGTYALKCFFFFLYGKSKLDLKQLCPFVPMGGERPRVYFVQPQSDTVRGAFRNLFMILDEIRLISFLDVD